MVKEFGRIVIPVDGSEGSKVATRKGLYLAKLLGVGVFAIHVINAALISYTPRKLSPLVKEYLESLTRSYINDVKKLGERMGVKVSGKVVEGIPYEEIVESAGPKDLIVIGLKGRTALDRILIGSVSEKVVRHAKCCVLVVK